MRIITMAPSVSSSISRAAAAARTDRKGFSPVRRSNCDGLRILGGGGDWARCSREHHVDGASGDAGTWHSYLGARSRRSNWCAADRCCGDDRGGNLDWLRVDLTTAERSRYELDTNGTEAVEAVLGCS